MSERGRSGHDDWVPRGRLRAVAAVAAGLVCLAFVSGFLVGRDVAPPAEAPSVGAEPGDGELLELLSRIEATATADPALDVLTFPQALDGGGPAPIVGEAAPSVTQVPPSAVPTPIGRPRDAAWIVLVAQGSPADVDPIAERLRSLGLDAWVAPVVVDGIAQHRVAVGAYPSEEAARAAVPVVRAAGVPASVLGRPPPQP